MGNEGNEMRGGARPGAGKKPANFDHARAQKLKEQGFSHQEIASRFGVSKWAIDWFFRRKREKAAYTSNQSSSQGQP